RGGYALAAAGVPAQDEQIGSTSEEALHDRDCRRVLRVQRDRPYPERHAPQPAHLFQFLWPGVAPKLHDVVGAIAHRIFLPGFTSLRASLTCNALFRSDVGSRGVPANVMNFSTRAASRQI